jgi:enoyl-[acyl-carrier protein] reductase I
MSQKSGLMQGKRGRGVASNRSMAWGIAKACHDAPDLSLSHSLAKE